MCMVSVINDYGHYRVPPQQWTRDSWNEYNEILRRLGELDRKLSQPECETPDKLDWQRDVERRLAELEQRAAQTSSPILSGSPRGQDTT